MLIKIIAEVLHIYNISIVRNLRKLEYVNSHNVWVPLWFNRKKNLMCHILTVILCSTVTKMTHNFEKNNHRQWIVDFFQQLGMKDVLGEWNGPLLTTGLHLKKVILCIWLDWKGTVHYKFLLQRPTLNYMYCSQLNWLKIAIDEKHLELVNCNAIIFHQDITRLYVSLWLNRNWYSLTDMSYTTHCTRLTMHIQIITDFDLYKMI